MQQLSIADPFPFPHPAGSFSHKPSNLDARYIYVFDIKYCSGCITLVLPGSEVLIIQNVVGSDLKFTLDL